MSKRLIGFNDCISTSELATENGISEQDIQTILTDAKMPTIQAGKETYIRVTYKDYVETAATELRKHMSDSQLANAFVKVGVISYKEKPDTWVKLEDALLRLNLIESQWWASELRHTNQVKWPWFKVEQGQGYLLESHIQHIEDVVKAHGSY